jgi:hypothetical protein
MATIATNLKVGTAAAAIAAAATVLPMQAAQADLTLPAPSAPAITDVLAASPLSGGGFAADLLCAPFDTLCVGLAADLNPSQQIFSVPLLGWFVGPFTVCSFGFSVKQGPYGSLSIGRSSSC